MKNKKNKNKKIKKTNRNKNKKSLSIFSILFKIIISPFLLIRKIFIRIKKRMRFSIVFKITASFVGIYSIIFCVVISLTALGYFSYRIYVLDKGSDEYYNIAIKAFENKMDYNDVILDKNIKDISIYDEKLDLVLSTNREKQRYLKDVISKAEEIIVKKEYTYSNTFNNLNGGRYYMNIVYSIDYIYYETYVILIFTTIAGIIGLLILILIGPKISIKIVEPIKNMTEVARTVTVNNINTRLNTEVSQDELRELSKTFNEMMDRIEDGYNSQQQFVSDASHEIRTPIAVIKGYVNMLDRWGKNDKAILEESIYAIKNETDNMQDLVEKLLFIARNDKNTFRLNREDFNILEILFEIEKETKMIDNKHNFKFAFYEDCDIYADKNRIKQAIRIFLENAIKFTPNDGCIEVSSYTKNNYYVIKIKDSGIGIEKKDMKKIFNRLYRTETSRNKDAGGHGLGLSIAKIIILGHKGKIKVKSKINEGSAFMVYLPYIKTVKIENDND